MSARDHHVAGQRPDWRGARPADAKANERAFKRALRNYRKYVRPMAEEPHSFMDSWLFLVPLGLMCIGILLWQAGVFK